MYQDSIVFKLPPLLHHPDLIDPHLDQTFVGGGCYYLLTILTMNTTYHVNLPKLTDWRWRGERGNKWLGDKGGGGGWGNENMGDSIGLIGGNYIFG